MITLQIVNIIVLMLIAVLLWRIDSDSHWAKETTIYKVAYNVSIWYAISDDEEEKEVLTRWYISYFTGLDEAIECAKNRRSIVEKVVIMEDGVYCTDKRK